MKQAPKKKKSSPKILIIDDDPFIPGIYKTKLEAMGYQAVVAKDGKEGLEKVKKIIPALVVLDIRLPQIDGFELLKILKKDKTLKKIPVLVASNLGEKKEIEKALSLGADDYLIKAYFTPTEVASKVEELLKNNKIIK